MHELILEVVHQWNRIDVLVFKKMMTLEEIEKELQSLSCEKAYNEFVDTSFNE